MVSRLLTYQPTCRPT